MRGADRGDQLLQHRETLQEMVFSHVIECSVLNSYVLESHAKPVEHALRGHQKRDFLRFRIELAEALIETFQNRKRAGRRRSGESHQEERLNPELGHWPIQVSKKLECVVCNIKRQKQHLSRSEL